MDEETRLRSLVQWYSAQLQGATHQLGQALVENAFLKEKLKEVADEKVSAGTQTD